MAAIQLLGHPRSKTTGKARRFFSERRVPVSYVDLRKRAPAPGELRKWMERFGHEALLDPSARAYREQGLSYLSASEESWLERMVSEPTILRLPLVRCGKELAVGDDPATWQRFVDAVKS